MPRASVCCFSLPCVGTYNLFDPPALEFQRFDRDHVTSLCVHGFIDLAERAGAEKRAELEAHLGIG